MKETAKQVMIEARTKEGNETMNKGFKGGNKSCRKQGNELQGGFKRTSKLYKRGRSKKDRTQYKMGTKCCKIQDHTEGKG